jgi:transposase InsO family protein
VSITNRAASRRYAGEYRFRLFFSDMTTCSPRDRKTRFQGVRHSGGTPSSWRRFTAEHPSKRWQADTTHWQLAEGTGVEILNLFDDHSRISLASVPRHTITGPDFYWHSPCFPRRPIGAEALALARSEGFEPPTF